MGSTPDSSPKGCGDLAGYQSGLAGPEAIARVHVAAITRQAEPQLWFSHGVRPHSIGVFGHERAKMSGKECFGVIIRTAGLALILLAGYNVSASAFVALTPERHHSMGPGAAIIYGLFFAVAGLLLLRGASWLVKFSYPPSEIHP